VSWPLAFTVERGKCRELESVLRATTEWSRAVPTYPVVLNHWGLSYADVLKELGVDVTRVMHGSEEYEYPRGLLTEGQRLSGELKLVSREAKQSRSGRAMTALRFQIELADETGELAVRITRTLLEIGA
jgi:hypothetical protein